MAICANFFLVSWKSKRKHTNYKIISLSVWICRLVFQYLFLSQPYPPIKFTKWSYEFFSTKFWNRKSSLMTIYYLKCNFYSHFMEHEFYVLKTNIITRPQNNLRLIFVCALFKKIYFFLRRALSLKLWGVLWNFFLSCLTERERIIDLHEIFLQQCFNSVKIAL